MYIKNVKELIVTQNKAVKQALAMGILMILMTISGLFKVYQTSFFASIYADKYLKIIFMCALALVLLLLIVRFFQFFKLFIKKTPAMILSQNGLWLYNYGLFPWENVAIIEEYVHFKNPFTHDLKGLGIRFHDPLPLLQNASWVNKKMFAWGRRAGNIYHIIIPSSLDVDHKEIVSYAHQFMKILKPQGLDKSTG